MTLPGNVDLSMALAVWYRNVAEYRRSWKTNLLPNFFEPVLYLVGMGLGLGAYLREGLDGRGYMEFIGPGLVAASAMNGATFETTYNMFIKMTYARLYEAYLHTPAQIQDIAVGELLFAVTRGLIYGCAFLIVLGVMTALGFPILTSPWAVAIPFAVALIALMFGAIGEVFTAHIVNINLYSYFYTLFLTPLFLFSGIFYPVERFPYGAEVAWFTPLYHGVRLCRGLGQGPLGPEHAWSAIWMLALTALALPLALRRLRRRLVA